MGTMRPHCLSRPGGDLSFPFLESVFKLTSAYVGIPLLLEDYRSEEVH